MRDPTGHDDPRPLSRWAELILIGGLCAVLLALWVLSLASVRAELAMWRWREGDVSGAHRLALLVARQKPERADMWALKGRSEERIGQPCEAALSYSRAVLAAGFRTSCSDHNCRCRSN